MKRTVLTIAALAAMLGFSPELSGLLELDRERVLSGELWRLVTCHLSHWSAKQLFWDAAALVLFGVTVRRRQHAPFTLLLISLGVSLTVLCFTEFEHYRGLSGLSVAMYTLALFELRDYEAQSRDSLPRRIALLGLIIFLGKTLFEAKTGNGIFVGSNEPYLVVPEAHIAGAVTALLVGIRRAPAAGLPRAYSAAPFVRSAPEARRCEADTISTD